MIDFSKNSGLIPAIIQDSETKQVLMLGYMNKEAFDKTNKEKRVTFYSRNKKRLWTKGEESGNFLKVVEIKRDCDDDTLLILVNPAGPVCHKGSFSCFGAEEFSLKTLETDIVKRPGANPGASYTALLLNNGVDGIGEKIIEEARELVEAGKTETKHRVVEEAADLLYHVLVLLKLKKVKLADIEYELEFRRGKKSKTIEALQDD